MKKLVTLALFVFTCAASFAQAIPQLERAQGKRVTFCYQYSLSRDGGDFSVVTSGDAAVEDNAFKVDGLGLTIISDGLTRWTLDKDAQELVIESVDKESILVNPALLIASYKAYLKDIKVVSGSEDSLDIIYSVEEDTRARFVLTGIKYQDQQGKSDFTLNEKSLPKSYVITDLR